MIFFNNEKYITNDQIEKCLLKYNEKLYYSNLTIVIIDDRKDIFELNYINDLYIDNKIRGIKFLYSLLKLKNYIYSFSNESTYSEATNTIIIYMNNLYGNEEEIRLQIISNIIYELIYSKNQLSEDIIKDRVKKYLIGNLPFLYNILDISRKYNLDDII